MLEHKRYWAQTLDWEGEHEVLDRHSGYDPRRAQYQADWGGELPRKSRAAQRGHPTLDGVMEESLGHVWGMVCHPCGWNPRLAVEELLKIKAGRWVGSDCKWLAKEVGP